MSIDSTWLRCPNCTLPLSSVSDQVVGCEDGHRFDVSKQGTVTLLSPRAPHTIGDNREMLEARRSLLDSGVFAPIADAIVAVTGLLRSAADVGPLRIADLGCGTGYYAGRLAETFSSGAFLVADRSPIAVRMAARAVPNSTGVVLDLWRPLPLRDAAADVVLNVFAPRNPTEFARVLRAGGTLVVVVPTAAHLGELRSRGGLLDVPAGKDAQVTAQLVSSGFSPTHRTRVEYEASVNAEQVAELIGMGPSAHHTGVAAGPLEIGEPTPPDRVTVSVDVLAFRRDAGS